MNKILILHPHGGMGDLILSYPVIQTFHDAFPDHSIVYITPPGLEEVIKAHPFVQEALPLKAGFISGQFLMNKVKKGEIKIACCLWTTSKIAWLLYLNRIPIRIGQGDRFLSSFLFTHKVKIRSAQGDTQTHWVEILLDYPRSLGLEPTNKQIRINPTQKAIENTAKLLQESGLNTQKPAAVIHCGKGENVIHRGWPLDLFAVIGDELTRAGFQVAFTGSKKEIPLVEAVIKKMNLPAFSLAGKTDFQTLAALLKQAKVVICPDSGPMHLAAAVGTPVVAIFAMQKDFPDRWKPWGVKSAIARPSQFPCRPWCTKETCSDFKCYQALSPQKIVEAALDLVK
ncbi:MAG: glycosyltransferase family 9 protein [Firmicutes bacterium]|nr:glycosyltransferase family 9 protein [Bacillota bacterium]